MGRDELLGLFVALGDEALQLALFDPPLTASADFDAPQVAFLFRASLDSAGA